MTLRLHFGQQSIDLYPETDLVDLYVQLLHVAEGHLGLRKVPDSNAGHFPSLAEGEKFYQVVFAEYFPDLLVWGMIDTGNDVRHYFRWVDAEKARPVLDGDPPLASVWPDFVAEIVDFYEKVWDFASKSFRGLEQTQDLNTDRRLLERLARKYQLE